MLMEWLTVPRVSLRSFDINILKDVVRLSTLGKLFKLKFEADDFAKGKSLIYNLLLFLHRVQ